MKKILGKLSSCLLAALMLAGSTAGCSKNTPPASAAGPSSAAASSQAASGAETKSYADAAPLTIDVFDSQANYQGVQSGWFAKVVKDRFNMDMNIIAPNVAGGGDTLFQTRSAAGNLGDLIFLGSENGRLNNTAKAGLLLDLTDKVSTRKNISAYPEALDMCKSLVDDGKLYAIPSQVSKQKATDSSEGLDLTYGPYLRWDYYTELGSPEIKTMDDLLPILKQMQEKHPTSDTGKKTYAFSLFKDWDGNMMCLGKNILACLYGYDEQGFQLLSADGATAQSIIDGDSWYIKGLEYFFKANQMGLVDPESTTQNYDTMYAKYQDGQVLYSPWPWLGQAAYNTNAHKAAGKGFMIAPVQDIKIFSYGCSPSGNKYMVGVGSKAQDPDRMIDFIDWLYSPEGVELSCSQTSGSCGPKGLTWDMKDGKPVLTDFGKKAFAGEDIQVPAEYGTGTWKDGVRS
jgi:multiple sugar transport system substrate-binding protein/putative aldouronate transport system substrate-binding protein